MKLRRLQHVSSPYPEGRQADVRRFYGDVLGLTEVPVPRTLDGTRLVWYAAGDGVELHFYPGDQAPGSARHLCLDVDDLAEARRRLTEASRRVCHFWTTTWSSSRASRATTGTDRQACRRSVGIM